MAMLDDFLLVLPRLKDEAKEDALQRGHRDLKVFDDLLHKLNLPKAPEKDQKPAFSTVWFGYIYYSEKRQYGIPLQKWEKLRSFFQESFVDSASKTLKYEFQATVVETALGKFHHVTGVWSAGRPMLYYLWRWFHSRALFCWKSMRGRRVRLLRPGKQKIRATPQVHEALRLWRTRLNNPIPPSRRMLRCGQKAVSTWINIFRLQQKTGPVVILGWPAAVAEYDVHERCSNDDGVPKKESTIWLEILLEGLEALEVPSELEVVYIRSNIRKLHIIIKDQLYIKNEQAVHVANAIHEQLSVMAQADGKPKEGQEPAIELCCALVPLSFEVKNENSY